jgi:hypothetical protein
VNDVDQGGVRLLEADAALGHGEVGPGWVQRWKKAEGASMRRHPNGMDPLDGPLPTAFKMLTYMYQGCQIILCTAYQNRKNIQKRMQNIPKCIRNCSKIDRMVIKFTNIFHCNTQQNLRKLGFLV